MESSQKLKPNIQIKHKFGGKNAEISDANGEKMERQMGVPGRKNNCDVNNSPADHRIIREEIVLGIISIQEWKLICPDTYFRSPRTGNPFFFFPIYYVLLQN